MRPSSASSTSRRTCSPSSSARSRPSSAAGIDVISLGIGDPDTPTYAPIVEAAQRAVADPSTHTYPSNRGRRRVPRGRGGLLRAPLRRRARPRDRGDAGDRRQGMHLQPQPGLPRSRRRGAGRRPRLPGLHRRPAPGRRRAGAHAPAVRAGLRPRPRRDSRRRRPSGRGCCSSTTRTTRPAPSCPTGFFDASSSSATQHDILVVHDNAYSETTYDGYVAPSFLEHAGRQGGRRRGLLALQGLQHDRLALRGDRRQRRRDRVSTGG